MNSKIMRKIRRGQYEYGNYVITNHGYYAPDKCVWWEAVHKSTGCADYHATTKRGIKHLIDTGAE